MIYLDNSATTPVTESVAQVAAQLVAEHALGARSCAVVLECAVPHHMLYQVKVLFHTAKISRIFELSNRCIKHFYSDGLQASP